MGPALGASQSLRLLSHGREFAARTVVRPFQMKLNWENTFTGFARLGEPSAPGHQATSGSVRVTGHAAS